MTKNVSIATLGDVASQRLSIDRVCSMASVWIAFAFLAAPCCAVLSACSASDRSQQSSELKQGDSNYPLINAKPTRLLKLYANTPDNPKVTFVAVYQSHFQSMDCSKKAGGGYSAPLFINDVIPLSRSGDAESATIALDKFEPGDCGWGFDSIGIRVDGSGLVNGDGTAYIYPIGVGATRGAGETEVSVDIWCTTRIQVFAEQHVACDDLGGVKARFGSKLTPAALSKLSEMDHGHNTPVYLIPSVQTLTIAFHDLDLINH